MLAGFEDISEGEIKIDEARINDLPPGARGLGMVFQSYALYPHMNIEDNLSFGSADERKKLSAEEIKSRVDEMARMLGLSDELAKRPKELSGGQRQRVVSNEHIIASKSPANGRTISNLDAELRHQMRGEICRLHEELGCTTIYVTHDQIEAMTLADIQFLTKANCNNTASDEPQQSCK